MVFNPNGNNCLNMKKITLLLLLTLSVLGLQAQTYQLNYDSIRVGKTAGTGATSLYGKTYLKNVSSGLSSDSILTVRNGRIFKIPHTTALTTTTISNVANANGVSITGDQIRLHRVSDTTGGVLTAGIDTIGGDKYFSDQIWITENQQFGGHIGIVSASGSLMAPLLGASSESSSNWLEILAHPAPNLYGTNPTDGIKFQVFNDEGPDPITLGSAYNFYNGTNSLFKIVHDGEIIQQGGLTMFDEAVSNGAISLGSGSGSLLAPSLGANSETSSYWFRFAGNPATNIDNTNPTDAFRFDAYKNKDTNVAMDGGNLLNLYNNNVTKFKVDWDGVTTAKSLNLTGLTASASVATDGSKNLVSVTNTGSGNNVLATSPTFTTGTTITTGTNGILNGSTLNYGYTSFNGSTSLTGMTGIFGGASGDAATLYHQAPTGGLHDFRVAGTDAFTLTETVATFSSLAGTGTRMVVASNTGAISTQAIPGGGGGSVTGVAVGTSNGFAGTSDGNAVVPTLTLTTTVNGMAKGNGTALSAATANTDYTLLNGTGLVSVNGSTTPVYNTTSSSISGIISDETGSGAMVFATSPTLVTPVLGNATGGTLSLSGTLTSTLGNNTVLSNATTATTGYQYNNIQNTTGRLQYGIEGSSAGTLITGGSAYAGVVTTVGTNNLELGTNQVKAITIDGTTQDVTIANNIYAANLTSGTYTPTLTNTSGIASSTAGTGSYQRIGNQVSGFVDFTATGTSEGVSGVFGVSLPIPSNFSSSTNVWGGYGVGRAGETIAPLEEVSADTTNDRFIVKATLTDLSVRTIRINFNYTIL